MKNDIYVTRPWLPDFDEYAEVLRSSWESGTITNNGPLARQLEKELCAYLGVEHASLVCNGAMGLSVALEALEVKGSVITTPFTFAATAHEIKRRRLDVRFVDIKRDCNIDEKKIEEAIDERTGAIMPMHCYGKPCNTQEIKRLSEAHDLRVIYDAAHAFGVKDDEGSILRHGDISVVSFHATKVFNTFEGGLVVSSSREIKERVDRIRNFGIADEERIPYLGTNAKMSEASAAMGIVQLRHIDTLIEKRRRIYERYKAELGTIKGIGFIGEDNSCIGNYGYMPIFVESESMDRNDLYSALKQVGIYTRKYFYPLLTETEQYVDEARETRGELTVAQDISSSILCLPIYPDLNQEEQQRIIREIQRLFYLSN